MNENKLKINTAMLLSAGFGTRMKPLTDNLPKPLVLVNQKPLIEYAIYNLKTVNITNFIVNVFAHKDKLISYFKNNKDVEIIEESEILETGGGIKNAVDKLPELFFISNTDSILLNAKKSIEAMINLISTDKNIDSVILVIPIANAFGYSGNGDFTVDNNNYIKRQKNNPTDKAYVFTGLQITRKSIFSNCRHSGKFSLNLIFDDLIITNKIKAIIHDDKWLHVGTPPDVIFAEKYIKDNFLFEDF